MDVQAYIDSGILELFVAGVLSEAESREVQRLAAKHPEIQAEIQAIENAYVALGESMAPKGSALAFGPVGKEIGVETPGVRTLQASRKPWITWAGWAAALLLGAGLIWMASERQRLREDVQVLQLDNQLLEEQVEAAREALAGTDSLMRELRARDISVVPLQGQQAAPEAYARVYWNRESGQLLIDALGLPEPPPGMVYQVWSLKLDPLTPTSLGLLEDFSAEENRIFALNNPNESEAFGITLEPAGGSESPTLEQLYTLGAV
ncbi:anti-sigma factor domain-containing protein [Robiginitalea sp. SC105]|uniref:anti-sigma factor n=1 Tax=Robiginitalea sp. SC105 TaxID=2762332 RepID=UPI001639DDB0|nr:anti-sigma factor [Robiginitalea sp. SC105]MBC2839377.1 anti-sigma factor [Robiginitalea sp. SC105]